MTELKRSLDRALSGVEYRPENRRRVRLAAFARQKPANAVRQDNHGATYRRPQVKVDFPVTVRRSPKYGRPESPQARRRFSAVLVIALVAVLILMAVAVAAVVARGFGWYVNQTDYPATQYRLNELDKHATVVGVQQTASTGGAQKDAVRFEVTQAYYDGSRVDVAYTLSTRDYSSNAAWRPAQADLTEMQFFEDGGELAFEDPASNRRMVRDYAAEGECGLHVHSYLIGENLQVNGEKYRGFDTYDKEWQDGMTGGYQILDNLPPKARDKGSVALTFSLTEYDLYYYRIPSGYYYRIVRGDAQMLEPVVVPRGKGETVIVKASDTFNAYRVYVRASVSPIEVEALICQTLPDNWVLADPWTRGRDLKGIDYIKEYRLFAGGSALASFQGAEGNGGGRLKGELPKEFRKAGKKKLYTFEIEAQGVPEGTQEIRLRPVYSISGEHPEEDVVLKIPQ